MNCLACDAGIPAVRRVTVPIAQMIQIRFPRSKKKRIRNKWAKRKENWQFNGIVYMAVTP